MGGLMTCARLRSVCSGMLAAGLLAAAASSAAAAAAPAPGSASMSEVQVTKTGISAILTASTVGSGQIDPATVKATIAGVAVPASAQPIAQERRVVILLIDTSGSMGTAGMQTVVRVADAFLEVFEKSVMPKNQTISGQKNGLKNAPQ